MQTPAGLGIGLTYKGKGSTGGFAIPATLLSVKTGIPLGRSSMFFDGTVILCAGFVFGPEKALYAIITVFLTSQTIDFVQIGLRSSKVALIVSKHQKPITAAIQKEMDRGTTSPGGHFSLPR